MQFEFVLIYAVIYFVAYYGCHFGNLLLRRILVKNLRIGALLLVALAAIVHFILIGADAPAGVDPLVLRVVQMQMSLAPAVIVAAVVAVKIWLENRKSGQVRKYGD